MNEGKLYADLVEYYQVQTTFIIICKWSYSISTFYNNQ